MRKIAAWLDEYSESESVDLLRELALHCALKAECEAGRRMAQFIRKDDLLSVCRFEVPMELTAYQMRWVRQAQACFNKLEFLELGLDKQGSAVLEFLKCEVRCRETNELFRLWERGQVSFKPDLCGVLHTASRHISRILGDVPTLDELRVRFGPGATSLTRKREASIKRKLSDGMSCSEDLVGWASALLTTMPHVARLHADYWFSEDEDFVGSVPVVVDQGRISFVRKNYKVDRTTETQPTLNGMLQLGLGDLMFERASRVVGLDLRDQTLNQRLARIGSLTGDLATLDQKSASNCISYGLVRSLLPLDWFELLRVARCGRTHVPSVGSVSLEMFSGMGNGYTFPLQSILFWSLAKATCESIGRGDAILSVYGDDVIVESDCAREVVRTLEHCGLVINHDKSYLSGPFRESCGADYLLGIDVRPVYVKEILTPAVLFSLANGLHRKGLHSARDLVHSWIHPNLKVWGPDGYGDGHLISDLGPEVWGRPYKRSQGFGGFTFSSYVRLGKRDFAFRSGDRILHTYATYMSEGATKRFLADVAMPVKAGRADALKFNHLWHSGHGDFRDTIPLDFGPEFGPAERSPDGLLEEGVTKVCAFPGVAGYKKVKIYTLG